MDCVCNPEPPAGKRRMAGLLRSVRELLPPAPGQHSRWAHALELAFFFAIGYFLAKLIPNFFVRAVAGFVVWWIGFKLDPPTERRSFWRVLFTYSIPKQWVPITAACVEFGYNVNWIQRLIVGVIGGGWMLARLIHAWWIRRKRAIAWMAEAENERWNRVVSTGFTRVETQQYLDDFHKQVPRRGTQR